MLLFAALIVVAENSAVMLPSSASISPSLLIIFAAVATFEPGSAALSAVVVGAAAGIVLETIRARRWSALVLNTSQYVLASVAAAALFHAPGTSDGLTRLVVATAAVGAFTVIQCGLVVPGVALLHRTSVRDVWTDVAPALPNFMAFGLVGVVVGLTLDSVGVVAIALLIMPVVISRFAFTSFQRSREAHEAAVRVFERLIEAKDPYTAGHTQRVAKYAAYIAEEIGLSQGQMNHLHHAALMHDVGKLAVPSTLLNKPGKLTAEEWDVVRTHNDAGIGILTCVDFMRGMAVTASDRHGHFATGHGATPSELVREAHIVAVADAFDGHDLHPLLPPGPHPGGRLLRAHREGRDPVQPGLRQGADPRHHDPGRALRPRLRGGRPPVPCRSAGRWCRLGRSRRPGRRRNLVSTEELDRRDDARLSVLAAALVIAGVVTGITLATVAGEGTLRLGVLAVVLAAGLLVHIPVLWGGSIPIGYALLIALPTIASLDDVTLVVAVALVVVGSVHVFRDGWKAAVAPMSRLGLCALAAALGSAAAMLVMDDPLAHAVGAALLLVPVELAVTRRIPVEGTTIDVRAAIPVLVTVICGAALITMARAEVGWEMTVVAAFPLVITRFAFQRSAEAEQTLRQIVQALGLVPELAGIAPLGRSERTAIYARRIARHVGCSRAEEERIVSASRLQHLDEVPSGSERSGPALPAQGLPATGTGSQAAQILEDAGFPAEVVGLVRRARAGPLTGPTPDLEVAVVRVASTFDRVVGEDINMVPQALGTVTAATTNTHSRLAAAALVELSATDPALVKRAIAAGATFREAASGLDLDVVTSAVGDLLPFARRRG